MEKTTKEINDGKSDYIEQIVREILVAYDAQKRFECFEAKDTEDDYSDYCCQMSSWISRIIRDYKKIFNIDLQTSVAIENMLKEIKAPYCPSDKLSISTDKVIIGDLEKYVRSLLLAKGEYLKIRNEEMDKIRSQSFYKKIMGEYALMSEQHPNNKCKLGRLFGNNIVSSVAFADQYGVMCSVKSLKDLELEFKEYHIALLDMRKNGLFGDDVFNSYYLTLRSLYDYYCSCVRGEQILYRMMTDEQYEEAFEGIKKWYFKGTTLPIIKPVMADLKDKDSEDCILKKDYCFQPFGRLSDEYRIALELEVLQKAVDFAPAIGQEGENNGAYISRLKRLASRLLYIYQMILKYNNGSFSDNEWCKSLCSRARIDYKWELDSLRKDPLFKQIMGKYALDKEQELNFHLHGEMIFPEMMTVDTEIIPIKRPEELEDDYLLCGKKMLELLGYGTLTLDEYNRCSLLLKYAYDYYESCSMGEQYAFRELTDEEYFEVQRRANSNKVLIDKQFELDSDEFISKIAATRGDKGRRLVLPWL